MTDISFLLAVPGVRDTLWRKAREIATHQANILAKQGCYMYMFNYNNSRRAELIERDARTIFKEYLAELGVKPKEDRVLEDNVNTYCYDNKTGERIE